MTFLPYFSAVRAAMDSCAEHIENGDPESAARYARTAELLLLDVRTALDNQALRRPVTPSIHD